MAARREQGFYSTLVSVSPEDILPNFETKSRRKARGRFYEVERPISKQGERIDRFQHPTHFEGR